MSVNSIVGFNSVNCYADFKLKEKTVNQNNSSKVAINRFDAPIYLHPSFCGLNKNLSTNVLAVKEKMPQYQFNPQDKKDGIPKHFGGVFPDERINIIGAGSIFEDFLEIGNITDSYYSDIAVYDPKFQKSVGEKFKKYDILPDESAINSGIAFIVSPTKFHASQLMKLSENPNLQGVYTDKPICINKEELAQLSKTVSKTDKPLYFGDFFFFSNLPALRLMGVKMPYKDAVDVEFDNSDGKKFSKCIEDAIPYFDKKEINSVVGKIVEQGHHHLLNRGWLQEKSRGGGVLLDLQTHISNLLNIMGLNLNKIDSATAMKYPFIESGVPGIDAESEMPGLKKNERGVFRPVKKGEVEDRVIVMGRINGNIPTYLECAQYMPERENYIMIEGKNGEKIRCSTDVFDKKVELLDENNNVKARARVNALPYSLMMHHVQNYFTNDKNNKHPMFFDVQKQTMNQIFAIKDMTNLN